MAKKRESETIRQQRLAREEYIKLKKMQSGEIPAAENIHIDADTSPKTPKEKLKHFWFYYGKLSIVAVICVAVLITLVVQCVNKPKYDIKIVYFSYSPVLDNATENLSKYFSKYTDDVNKDGEKNVSVINCSYSNNGTDNITLTKLQAIIAAEPDTLIFITDEESYKYFEKLNSGDLKFFEDYSCELSDKVLKENGINTEKKLTMNLRRVENTTLAKNKDTGKYYKASKNLIKKIKSK